MSKIEFVGGRFDGLKLSSGLGASFLWTDGKRCYRAPAKGRYLYRAMGQDARASRYRFVGMTYGLCECGVYRKRDGSCQMCGSEALQG